MSRGRRHQDQRPIGETELENPGQIRRVQIGRPIEELPTSTLLQNQQVRVGELSTQAVYHRGESRERIRGHVPAGGNKRYTSPESVQTAPCGGRGTWSADVRRRPDQNAGRTGAENNRTICEMTYQDGVVKTKKENRKEYLVDAVAGVNATS